MFRQQIFPHPVIIGAGRVGRIAAQTALLNGAKVKLFGLKENKIENLRNELPGANIDFFSDDKLAQILPDTDVLIISVYSLKKQYDLKITSE